MADYHIRQQGASSRGWLSQETVALHSVVEIFRGNNEELDGHY